MLFPALNRRKDCRVAGGQLARLPEIATLIDIGVGHKGTPELYEHFPDADYLLIDPLRECRDAVATIVDNEHRFFVEAAAGAANTAADIKVASKLSQSSFFEKEAIMYKAAPVSERRVPIRRLDDIVTEHPCPGPYGIKIDTEGYELEVLKGARATLKETRFVIMEVRYSKSFMGSYAFSELMKEVYDNGFVASMVLTVNTKFSDMVFEPADRL